MYNLVIRSCILFWIDDWTEERNFVAKNLVRKKPFFFLDYLLTCFRQNYDPDLHSEYEESEGYFGIPLCHLLWERELRAQSLTIAAEEVVPVRTNKWYPSVGQSAPPDLTHVKVLSVCSSSCFSSSNPTDRTHVDALFAGFIVFVLSPTRSHPSPMWRCCFCFSLCLSVPMIIE